MNNSKSNFWWKLLLALLVMANLATLGTVWVLKKKTDLPLPQRERGNSASSFISKELGFDKKQQEAYQKLVKTHQEDVMEIREALRTSKDEFFSLLSKGDAPGTVQEAEKIATVTGGLEKRIDLLTFTHFKQVRALCTEKQKKKFDSVIQQVMRMMGSPRPSGPPPGNGILPPGKRHGYPPQSPEGKQVPPPHDGKQRPPRYDGQQPPPPGDGQMPPPPRHGNHPPPPPPDGRLPHPPNGQPPPPPPN